VLRAIDRLTSILAFVPVACFVPVVILAYGLAYVLGPFVSFTVAKGLRRPALVYNFALNIFIAASEQAALFCQKWEAV